MLSKILQTMIEEVIDSTFDGLRLYLLGPAKTKSIIFSQKNFSPDTTLASAYIHANAANTVDPDSVDKKSIEKVLDVANNYLDALKEKTTADVIRIIGEKMDDASLKAKLQGTSVEDFLRTGEGKSIIKSIHLSLKEQKNKIDKAADLIVTHELHNAQNVGSLDGILGMAKTLGIDDPTIFKIGVMDLHRCSSCWSLWTLPNKVTPKVYKLSELKGSPGNYKNPDPSVSPTHPQCRDILLFLTPGFGFDDSGSIKYMGQGYDEYKKQRGIKS